VKSIQDPTSDQEPISEFGTYMQIFKADDYRGKRVRFSAAVRTQGVEGWAGLWMRIDGPDVIHPVSFDNMQDRPLQGDTACKRHSVVLNVARNATHVACGLLLSGKGQASLDSVRFEVVDNSVQVTDLLTPKVVEDPDAKKLGKLNIDALQNDEVPTGRVGHVWFNRGRVEASTLGVPPGSGKATNFFLPNRSPVPRARGFAGIAGVAFLQPDGSWRVIGGDRPWQYRDSAVRGGMRGKPVKLTVTREGFLQ